MLTSFNIIVESDILSPDDARGAMGAKVQANLEFLDGVYFGEGNTTIAYEGLALADVIMEVTVGNNIVSTQIAGMKGTFKQYISRSDYQIRATGRLFRTGSMSQIFPEEQFQRLNEIANIPQSIGVRSMFLNLLGITEVVFSEISFSQVEAKPGEILFEFSLLSDEPFELIIEE